MLLIDATVPVRRACGNLFVNTKIIKADSLTFDSIESFACESVNVLP